MVAKAIAIVLIVASIVLGAVWSYFIAEGYTLQMKWEIDLGVDHAPQPEIHYHIKKEGVWGA